MAKPQIRLSQSTIDAVTDLGQKCGIEDIDTLLSLIIRKYGHSLITLLSPSEPICDKLLQSVTEIASTESKTPKPPKSATTGGKTPLDTFLDFELDD